jgi:hypothetical protein
MNQDDMGRRGFTHGRFHVMQRGGPILFHPDYTVGPGVAPDLLDIAALRKDVGNRSRAVPPVGNYAPP